MGTAMLNHAAGSWRKLLCSPVLSSVTSLLTCMLMMVHMLHPEALEVHLRPAGSARSAVQLQQAARGGAPMPDCLLAAVDGWWQRIPVGPTPGDPPSDIAARNPADAFKFFNEALLYQWGWYEHPRCDIRRRSRAEIGEAFRSKRLLFLGDSHVRNFHNHIAATLGGKQLPKGNGLKPDHIGINLAQVVPPFNVSMQLNITLYAKEIQAFLLTWTGKWPDVLVMDASAWHLYTLKNVSDYTQQIQQLLQVLRTRVPPSVAQFWVSPPLRDTAKAQPKEQMPNEWMRIYNRVVQDQGLTYPSGPAHHLDLYTLAQDCLPWCMGDGVHIGQTGNEVAMQQLVNILLQRGQQQPPDILVATRG